MPKVLLVDDEEMVHALVSTTLRVLDGVQLESAYHGQEAEALLRRSPPDLLIADIGLPDMDGLTLARRVRETPELADLPILLLTARDQPHDKYRGFLDGADDYVVKPFDPLELQFRVKALLRRGGSPSEKGPTVSQWKFGPYVLNEARYVAETPDDGPEVKLTGAEFAILKYLAQHPERVVNTETLLVSAMEYPPGVGNPAVIHTHMRNIRQKLRDALGEPTFLQSSRLGYMLTAAN